MVALLDCYHLKVIGECGLWQGRKPNRSMLAIDITGIFVVDGKTRKF
jgi:hypothetical protein